MKQPKPRLRAPHTILAVAAAVVCALAAAGGAPARAQTAPVASGATLFAGSVDSGAFPEVSLRFAAVDSSGLPILALEPAVLRVTENGQPVAPDRLTLQAVADTPLDLVIALDRSTDQGSWTGTQAAVYALLEQLRPGDEVALLSYAETVDVLSAPTQDVGQMRAALTGAAPGGTLNALYDAIEQAQELLGPGEGRRQAIVVIANGPNDLLPEGVLEPLPTDPVVQRARAGSVAIQMMGYGPAAAGLELFQLASGTGGRAVAATAANDLFGHVQSLPGFLRQGYAFAYDSALLADGSPVELAVALGDLPPVARTFVAQPGQVLVRITQPGEGATVSGQVVLGLSAQAPAPIAAVTFALEDGEIITTTTGPVSGIIWDSAAVDPGQRRVSVTVQDRAGNAGFDDVDLDVRAPLVLRVEAPADRVRVGATALVTATVESAFSSPVVELFVGRTQVGMRANPVGPAVFEVDTSAFAPGTYGVSARATNSAGYIVTDNSSILTLVAPPATAGSSVAVAAQRTLLWIRRSWPWLALAAGLAALLIVALWLAQRLRHQAQERQARQASERARLVPQVRLLLTNAGNTRTRYRLLARDAEGLLGCTFLVNGRPLVAPAVARVERPAAAPIGVPAAPTAQPAANGGDARPAAAPAPASAAKSASQVAATAGQLFAGMGQLLPGAAGAQMQKMAGGVRSSQAATARTRYELTNTVEDVHEVAALSGHPAPAAPPRPVAAPPADAAFALQPPQGGAPPAAPAVWVYTDPVGPGETLGIDIHVAPLRRLGRNKQVTFTVLSAPVDLENVPPLSEEVSVRLSSAR